MTSRGAAPKNPGPEAEQREWERVRSWTNRTLSELDRPPVSEHDRKRKDAVRRNLTVSQPLVEELQRAGIPLRQLGELGNVQLIYPDAAPILLAHLERPYPEDIRLAILQALQRPYGKTVFARLRDQLKRNAATLSEDLLFSYGAAVTANAAKSDVADLAALIEDPALGVARITIAVRAARWLDPRIADAVRRLFRERSLEWAALRAARLQKLWDMSEDVRPYLTHAQPDFREEARAYFRALEKAQAV
jgi:hypothetical protein